MRGVLFILVLMLATFPAFAAAPKSLGTFGAWQAYTYQEDTQPVCYMVQQITFAKNKKDKKPGRGPALLMVTQRPAENSLDTISYTSGYNFRPASSVKIIIGKESFSLFTTQDSAWARDARTDHAVAKAMQSGTSAIVTGIPSRKGSTATTDSFSLKDAPAAYRAIGRACGLIADTPPKPAPKAKKKHK